MQTLLNYVETLIDSIVGLLRFVVQMVGDLIYLVQLLAELLPALPSFFTFLPSAVVTTVMTAFAVFVILRVLGRD